MNRSITMHRGGAAVRLFVVFSLTALLVLAAATGRAAPPPSFADLAEKLGPSVVNIYTTQTVQAPGSPHQFFFEGEELPELFRRFFDLPSPHSRPPGGTPPRGTPHERCSVPAWAPGWLFRLMVTLLPTTMSWKTPTPSISG